MRHWSGGCMLGFMRYRSPQLSVAEVITPFRLVSQRIFAARYCQYQDSGPAGTSPFAHAFCKPTAMFATKCK